MCEGFILRGKEGVDLGGYHENKNQHLQNRSDDWIVVGQIFKPPDTPFVPRI